MLIETRVFGQIEIEEKEIITFPEGIPGFEDVREYVLLKKEKEENPFFWLQSVRESFPAFIVADPWLILPDYSPEMDDTLLKSIEISDKEQLLCLVILVVPEDVKKIRANLKAPVVINKEKKLGKQIILENSKYKTKHYLLPELGE